MSLAVPFASKELWWWVDFQNYLERFYFIFLYVCLKAIIKYGKYQGSQSCLPFSLGPYHPHQRACCYSIFPCDFLKSLTHILSPVTIGNTRTFPSVVLVALCSFLSWADLNFSLGYLNCRVILPPHLFYSLFSPKCHFVIGCLSTNRTRQEGLHSVLYLRVFWGALASLLPPCVAGVLLSTQWLCISTGMREPCALHPFHSKSWWEKNSLLLIIPPPSRQVCPSILQKDYLQVTYLPILHKVFNETLARLCCTPTGMPLFLSSVIVWRVFLSSFLWGWGLIEIWFCAVTGKWTKGT